MKHFISLTINKNRYAHRRQQIIVLLVNFTEKHRIYVEQLIGYSLKIQQFLPILIKVFFK